jgi:hypothetical protein
MAAIPEGEELRQTWNSLPRAGRLEVRPLVRKGRPADDRREATVAAGVLGT